MCTITDLDSLAQTFEKYRYSHVHLGLTVQLSWIPLFVFKTKSIVSLFFCIVKLFKVFNKNSSTNILKNKHCTNFKSIVFLNAKIFEHRQCYKGCGCTIYSCFKCVSMVVALEVIAVLNVCQWFPADQFHFSGPKKIKNGRRCTETCFITYISHKMFRIYVWCLENL